MTAMPARQIGMQAGRRARSSSAALQLMAYTAAHEQWSPESSQIQVSCVFLLSKIREEHTEHCHAGGCATRITVLYFWPFPALKRMLAAAIRAEFLVSRFPEGSRPLDGPT